ncbi:MAG: hypothetical protein AB1941_00605 [Gemmatimonadota bacterium]
MTHVPGSDPYVPARDAAIALLGLVAQLVSRGLISRADPRLEDAHAVVVDREATPARLVWAVQDALELYRSASPADEEAGEFRPVPPEVDRAELALKSARDLGVVPPDHNPWNDLDTLPESTWFYVDALGAWYTLHRGVLWEIPGLVGEDTSPRRLDADDLDEAQPFEEFRAATLWPDDPPVERDARMATVLRVRAALRAGRDPGLG